MEDKQRGGFIFYRSIYEASQDMDDATRLALYDAIIAFALDGEEPSLNGWAKSVFVSSRPTLANDRSRWANGCNGGAPKGSRNNPKGRGANKPKSNQELTENKPKSNQELSRCKMKDERCTMNDDRNSVEPSATLTPEEIAFNEFLTSNAPSLLKFKAPLQYDQYNKLVQEYGREMVGNNMAALENMADETKLKKYKSAYLTLRNWCNMDKKRHNG